MRGVTSDGQRAGVCAPRRVAGWAAAAAAALFGCRPGDILSVPPPAGVQASSIYRSQAGAEAAYAGASGAVFAGFTAGGFGSSGLFLWSGVLTDEFSWADLVYATSSANVDARITTGGGGFSEPGDGVITMLLSARASMLLAVQLLRQYEPPAGRGKIGAAYALTGYTELLLAEDYCAGVPLGQVLSNGGIAYGAPVTSDSLYGAAQAHFDSALGNAGGNDTVRSFASVGLGRTLLDRGQFAAAGTAVSAVPTDFVYTAQMAPYGAGSSYANNFYSTAYSLVYERDITVADREGTNGLNFVSAGDPRLVIDSTAAQTDYGSPWYYPVKFGEPPTGLVALATGVEARLIEAEAALKAGQVGVWAQDLNALRADAADTKVTFPAPTVTIPPDSTTGAGAAEQVDVMFRERAFWLFGTGTRLGDLRRLIRQYGRDQSTVFPIGTYIPYVTHQSNFSGSASPLLNYGTDVSITLPTGSASTTNSGTSTSATPNPTYKGCLTSTKIA